MIRRYLLTAGSRYYPVAADGDWIGIFTTVEEAKARIQQDGNDIYALSESGARMFLVDWARVIDLQDWQPGSYVYSLDVDW